MSGFDSRVFNEDGTTHEIVVNKDGSPVGYAKCREIGDGLLVEDMGGWGDPADFLVLLRQIKALATELGAVKIWGWLEVPTQNRLKKVYENAGMKVGAIGMYMEVSSQ